MVGRANQGRSWRRVDGARAHGPLRRKIIRWATGSEAAVSTVSSGSCPASFRKGKSWFTIRSCERSWSRARRASATTSSLHRQSYESLGDQFLPAAMLVLCERSLRMYSCGSWGILGRASPGGWRWDVPAFLRTGLPLPWCPRSREPPCSEAQEQLEQGAERCRSETGGDARGEGLAAAELEDDRELQDGEREAARRWRWRRRLRSRGCCHDAGWDAGG